MSRSRLSTTVSLPNSLVRPRRRHRGRLGRGRVVGELGVGGGHGRSPPAMRSRVEVLRWNRRGTQQREHDQEGGEGEHQRADRVDGRRDAEPDRGVDPHRQRLRVDTGREEGQHEVVEDEREDEQSRAQQGRHQRRQDDLAHGLPRRAAEVAGGLLDLGRHRGQPAADDHGDVGDREGDLGQRDGDQRELHAEAGEEQQRRDAGDDLRGDQRQQRHRADGPAAAATGCARGRGRAWCRGSATRRPRRRRCRGSRTSEVISELSWKKSEYQRVLKPWKVASDLTLLKLNSTTATIGR